MLIDIFISDLWDVRGASGLLTFGGDLATFKVGDVFETLSDESVFRFARGWDFLNYIFNLNFKFTK